MLKKWTDLFVDATVGLVKQYQMKTLSLAKIKTAEVYVKTVKALRQQFISLCALVFCMVLIAVSLVVIPVVLIFCAPWTLPVKIALTCGLTVLTIILPLTALRYILSEKKWMEFTKAADLVENALNGQS